MRISKFLFILMSVLLGFSGAKAQNNLNIRPALKLRVFHGLNTSTNPFTLEPGYASVALNIDFSKETNSISARDGFTIVSDGLKGATGSKGTFNGIFGYYKNDGVKRLFVTYQPDDSTATFASYPYELLLRSDQYEIAPESTSFGSYIYKDSKSEWLVYDDILIHTNGYNRPLRYVDDNFRPLVDVPPGYLDFRPMAEITSTNQVLNGEYHYYWTNFQPSKASVYTDFTQGPSPLVVVDSDWVLINSFDEIGISVDVDVPDTLMPDTTVYRIYRTKAGATYNDSVFIIEDSFEVVHGTTPIFIDSIPDDSLGITEFYDGGAFVGYDTTDCTGACDSTRIPHLYIGLSNVDTVSLHPSNHAHYYNKVGSPSYLATDTSLWSGISKGLRERDTIWTATLYAYMWYDSSTGMVTDTGRSIWLDVQSIVDDSIRDSANVLGLLNRNPDQASYWILVCRAQVTTEKVAIPDTGFNYSPYQAKYISSNSNVFQQVGNQLIKVPPGYYCYESGQPGIGGYDLTHSMRFQSSDGTYWCKSVAAIPKDTVVTTVRIGTWRIIDTVKTDDSVYVDDLAWGTEFDSKPPIDFEKPITIPQLHGPVEYKKRIWMFQGNDLYFSDVDNPVRWYDGDKITIGNNDGDEITALYSTGDLLYIFKNNSWWALVEQGVGDFTVKRFIDGIGATAPRSVVELPGGVLCFMHTSGIYMLTGALQSLYKESSGNLLNISEDIQNIFDDYSVDTLSQFYAWMSQNKKVVNFSNPLLDSTYSYSIATKDWSVWSMNVQQVTHYDSVYSAKIKPSNDILFVDGDKSYIYKIGGTVDQSTAGASQPINIKWRSLPLFAEGVLGDITGYASYKDSTTGVAITTRFINESGDTVSTITDYTTDRYKLFDVFGNPARYFSFEYQCSAYSKITIRGLDLWWTKASEEKEN